jgi:hypothetical protein
MLFTEIVGAYCENQTKYVNTKYGKIKSSLMLKPAVHVFNRRL